MKTITKSRLKKIIKEEAKIYTESKEDTATLSRLRQDLTKISSNLSNYNSKDPKVKKAIDKAENLVDKARTLLFDVQ